MNESSVALSTLPIETVLHYFPNTGEFCIDGKGEVSFVDSNSWEILSMSGSNIALKDFFTILKNRSEVAQRGKTPNAVTIHNLPVHVPIRILKVAPDDYDSVVCFQLTGHAYAE